MFVIKEIVVYSKFGYSIMVIYNGFDGSFLCRFVMLIHEDMFRIFKI